LDTFFEGSLPEVSPLGESLGTFPSSTTEGLTNPLSFIPEALPPSPSSFADPQPVLEPFDIADPHQSSVSSTGVQITHSNAPATHYCNEHTSLPSDSKSTDIIYQYEVVLSHSIDLHDALIDIKKEVLASLADSFSCTTESMRRNLRDIVLNSTLIGIQEGVDKVDTDKESCSKASFSGCIPIVSHLTGYFDSATSDEEIQITRDEILYTIQQGMLDGRYNSDQIRWIVFSSDDAKSSSFESVYVIPHHGSSGSVWVPIASTLICSLIIVIAIVVALIFKGMNKNGVASDQVLPASQSVIEKLQNPKEHSSEESNDASLESEEPICLDDDVELQESQD